MNDQRKFRLILIIFLFFLAGVFFAQPIALVTADLGRHLKNGEIFFRHFLIPQTNFYSYTYPDFPFLNHHWGSGVVFYLINQVFGFTGLSVFYLLVSLAAFLVFFLLAEKKSKTEFSLLFGLLALPMISARYEIRPEMFSYLFSGLFWLVLEFVRLGKINKRWLFVLPLIELFWVNLHIYFFFGFFLSGVYILDEIFLRVRKLGDFRYLKNLIIVAILSLLACLLNPSGIKGVLYPFQIFNSYGYRLFENQSVWFLDKIVNYPLNLYFKILLGLLAVSWAVLFVKKGKFVLSNLLISVFVTYLGLTAVRNFTFFGLFSFPIIAQNFKSIYKGEARSLMGYYIEATILLLLTIFLFILKPSYWIERMKPGLGLNRQSELAAEFFLKNKLTGPVFNNYDNGGYLIYYLYPREKVFVDNRPEAYPPEFFTQIYVPMQEKEEKWYEFEEKYNFNAIFFYRHDLTPWGQNFLINRIKDKTWVPVFVDDFSIIFLKDNEINHSLIQRFALPRSLFSIST